VEAWTEKAKGNGQRVAVVAGVRTPFAKAGTNLKDCSAVHLGVNALREALALANVAPGELDEVIIGNAGTPADAANIARVIALRSGVPASVSAFSVHRNCASAMEAIAQGCMKIASGQAEVVAVGGTESMSNMPLIFGEELKALFTSLTTAKTSGEKLQKLSEFRPGWLKPVVAIMEGLTDPISGLNMGQTAEVLARDFGITREEQDAFALRSHQRAVEAQKAGRLGEEIQPVVLEPEYDAFLDKDVGPRDGQSIEALRKLRPFFDKETGTITAGNACPITDGAAVLVLMSEARAKSGGHTILGYLTGYAFAGCDPKRMGIGPTYSTAKLFDKSGHSMADIDRVELNEAFAAQVIANQRAFASKKYCEEKLGRKPLGELSDDKLNVNGGAIALGHPVGATGARIVLTLLKELRRSKKQLGLATLCIGGGQGGSFLVEANA
jgi:acetyl-CoA C-acetyltransferase/acetyl-CoA acyltransferase